MFCNIGMQGIGSATFFGHKTPADHIGEALITGETLPGIIGMALIAIETLPGSTEKPLIVIETLPGPRGRL